MTTVGNDPTGSATSVGEQEGGEDAAGSTPGAPDLANFLAGAGGLSLADRRTLVEQALVLLEQNYVHLPLKESMHAVDPVQALRLLRHRLESMTAETMPPEIDFHREMLEIFTSVRDLHTNYLLPAPFANKIAVMPFDIEAYYVDGKRRYTVAHLEESFDDDHFTAGVEITHWNGVPIDRAAHVNADRYGGSNLEARRARGIAFLTRRALRTGLPPDEHWVRITYRDALGVEREFLQPWLVLGLPPRPSGVATDEITVAATSMGMDLELELVQRIKRQQFAPSAGQLSEGALEGSAAPAAAEEIATQLDEYFRARVVETTHGTFGHLRIFSFNIDDPDAFVGEFARLIGLLPQRGLILDVRGNGGGHIYASEGLLQLLTPKRIEPEPTQFISTALNLRMCRRHKDDPVGLDLGPWVASLEQAVETGATFSRGTSITPHDFANAIGQRYHGSVVLITDALCYSATDILAAGFQDHGIGPILGVDGNTGAGGANVWTHDLLSQIMKLPAPPDPASPYRALPGGAGMRVSIRRTLRVHDQSGSPLEDLGVVPDHRHDMTLDDLLHGNRDLLEEAGRLLADRPVRTLLPTLTEGGGLDCETVGLDRLDISVDGRFDSSIDISDDTHTITLHRSATREIQVDGYLQGEQVACRRIALS